MEAIIIGIGVDIGLGLLFIIGKKLFLTIRDYYRHSKGIYIKFETPTVTKQSHVDKKEIDDEVQKAVEKLVPSLAERVTKQVGHDYSSKSSKNQITEPLPCWTSNESYTGFTGACGITVQDIETSTPNSNKPSTSYEKFLDNIAKVCDKKSDKELVNAIAENYRTFMDDKPKKVADAFQAHLDYVRDVIKCMEEWGEMPVPSEIRTKMVNAESVDDLLSAEDEYHKIVSAHFRGKKYKPLHEMHNRITSVEQPFMLTDSYGGGGEIDREILASSAFDSCPTMFDYPRW